MVISTHTKLNYFATVLGDGLINNGGFHTVVFEPTSAGWWVCPLPTDSASYHLSSLSLVA